jgi:hypothetical protein
MISECRHTREAYGSRVWPGDPRAAAGGICPAGCWPASWSVRRVPGGTVPILRRHLTAQQRAELAGLITAP